MRRHDLLVSAVLLALIVALGPAALHAAPLQVMQTAPPRNTAALPSTAVVVDFDKAVNPTSVNANTFRVFGRASGSKTGSYVFSNGNQRVTFQPSEPFSAGETVRITLSHDLAAADLTTLRPAGFFYQFGIATLPGGTFQQIDVLSNRIAGAQTRIYGAAAADLNNDGSIDLATINEVSADVRVCLSRDDGSGLYQPFLAPVPIGVEASPNDPADFNNDGNTDLCISASSSNSVWVLLGAGDGTFSSVQEIPVGDTPHAIASIDVDGDGDADIANANQGLDMVALMINNGSGVFGAASFFDAGVDGEYGLAAADMNNDGIADLVVGGNDGDEIRVLLGNGNATFTPAGLPQPCGGAVWVVIVDDVNGDGNLDAGTANSFNANGAILLGNGAGAFGPPAIISTGFHTPSTDFGDLDGDGDADLVLSVFSGGFWRTYLNDGAGTFTFEEEFTAPDNPSCAVLYDSDNDGDLDIALTDEIADVILVMRNLGAVGVDPRPIPERLALLPNAPNPFHDATSIRFALPTATEVRLDVFDIRGRKVSGSGPVLQSAGWHDLRFDGRDRDGRLLAPGVYLYRLSAGDVVGSGRMVVAR